MARKRRVNNNLSLGDMAGRKLMFCFSIFDSIKLNKNSKSDDAMRVKFLNPFSHRKALFLIILSFFVLPCFGKFLSSTIVFIDVSSCQMIFLNIEHKTIKAVHFFLSSTCIISDVLKQKKTGQ